MHFRPARTSSVPTWHRRVLGRLLALAVALVVLVPAGGTVVPPVYQLVRPLPPARLSEMCTWLRCRSVSEHELSTLQPL